jgi:predicted phage tail protein
MNELVNIHLGGKLGKIFGKIWRLDVSGPAEAIRAICINTEGKFREYFETEGRNKYYKVCVGNKKNILSAEEIKGKTGKSDIYIMPVIKMSGKGFLQILVGVALIALVVATGGAAGFLGQFAQPLLFAGVGLAIGGIVTMLTPVPKMQDNRGDNRTSSIFQGNATTISQNSPVGLIYGRVIVAPMPIALSFDNFPQDNKNKTNIAIPTIVENPDGSFYYSYN